MARNWLALALFGTEAESPKQQHPQLHQNPGGCKGHAYQMLEATDLSDPSGYRKGWNLGSVLVSAKQRGRALKFTVSQKVGGLSPGCKPKANATCFWQFITSCAVCMSPACTAINRAVPADVQEKAFPISAPCPAGRRGQGTGCHCFSPLCCFTKRLTVHRLQKVHCTGQEVQDLLVLLVVLGFAFDCNVQPASTMEQLGGVA
jgi:hypothetical protein